MGVISCVSNDAVGDFDTRPAQAVETKSMLNRFVVFFSLLDCGLCEP